MLNNQKIIQLGQALVIHANNIMIVNNLANIIPLQILMQWEFSKFMDNHNYLNKNKVISVNQCKSNHIPVHYKIQITMETEA